MRSSQPPTRRGFTLVVVLVIMSGGILVATGLIFVAQTEIAGVAGAERRVQTQALAWSGVEAIMVRLNEQREEILTGRTPELDEQYVIYETPARTMTAKPPYCMRPKRERSRVSASCWRRVPMSTNRGLSTSLLFIWRLRRGVPSGTKCHWLHRRGPNRYYMEPDEDGSRQQPRC